MNDPIRPDQEDRYVSPNSPQKVLSDNTDTPILSKKKWGILILALCLILIIVGWALLKPSSQQHASQSDMIEDASNAEATENPEYQVLTPPEISTTATETKQSIDQHKERIEIPGEVIDILEEKINQLNTQKTSAILIQEQNHSSNDKTKELPLEKILNNNYYTIQMSSSSSIESLMAFVKQNQLTNYQIYETHREKKPWFILIKGNYATIEDAKKAMSLLPIELQKSNPWIKSGESVNKEKSLP